MHLISCVGVDTEYEYLAHFIAHYRALGVDPASFHIILNTRDEASPNLERAITLLRDEGLPAPDVWIAPYTSDSMWAKRREVQARVAAADDWVISADVDEFHEYPLALSALLAECERQGVNCLQGVLIDRLAADGRLAPVRADVALGQTFPIQADVQCTIGQTGQHHDWFGTVKAMAFKGALFPARGGHHVEPGRTPVRYLFGRRLATFPGIGKARFRFLVPLRVHHYKWSESMPKALRQRLATPGVSAAGAEYGQKLIAYIDRNHGIRLPDVPVRNTRRAPRLSWRSRLAYMKTLDALYWYMGKPRRMLRGVARRRTSS